VRLQPGAERGGLRFGQFAGIGCQWFHKRRRMVGRGLADGKWREMEHGHGVGRVRELKESNGMRLGFGFRLTGGEIKLLDPDERT
jgi:hypothetical protein